MSAPAGPRGYSHVPAGFVADASAEHGATDASRDPVRFCVFTTIALLALVFGPAPVLLAMALLGLRAYRRAMARGLTESRCVLRRPRLVLAYLGVAALVGAAGTVWQLSRLPARIEALRAPDAVASDAG